MSKNIPAKTMCALMALSGSLLTASSSHAGGGNYAQLYKLYGPDYLSRQGYSQDTLGDINNDGNPDFIVGDIAKARVTLYSGKNGSEIATYNGYAAGIAVANLKDVDGDGVDDFAYGDPRANSGGVIGSAYIYSGKTRTLIRTHSGNYGNWDMLGSSIANVGDVNGDMVPDYMISADTDKLGIGCGNCVFPTRMYSGLFGNLLYEVRPAGTYELNFGNTIQAMKDLNGDAVPDFAVADPLAGVSNNNGTVYFYSGKNGAKIMSLTGSSAWVKFGYAIEVLGDLNQDGYQEFAIGAPAGVSTTHVTSSSKGYVNVYSGNPALNFPLLYHMEGDSIGSQFGKSIASLPDIDKDGVSDFVVGAPLEDKGAIQDVGKITFFSGATGNVIFPIFGNVAKGDFGHSLKHAFSINGNGQKNIIAGQASGVDQVEKSNVRTYALASNIAVDTDGDEVPNIHDSAPNNVEQSGDLDHDSLDNIVDIDDDGDGIPDTLDASQYGMPYVENPMLPLDANFKGSSLRENSAGL